MGAVSQPVEFAGNARFRLVRRIGAGGMGVVWEAFDQEHGRRVALKTLRTVSADALSRFKNEFRALQDLHHDNLVSLGELFEHEGHWFFTMDLVHGCDFLAWVRPRVDGQPDPIVDPSGADTEILGGGPVRGTVRSTRPGPRFHEARLRSALGQLARGVHALHAAQKVHRDLKPSNILVTDDQRVVILDFGLITEANDAAEDKLVGTVGFMSPEQASARAVGPASDWYSVGVLLYLALAGRLPFDGAADDVIALKQRVEPIPPLAICPDVPRDLDRLCADLLKVHPESRPDGAEVLRRLDQGDLPALVTPPFVGRKRELEVLHAGHDEARAGRRAVVCLRGESGVGKSALAAHFTGSLRNAVVLEGRCYERESVPYKGVDGAMDELAAHLERLGPEIAELLPRDVGLLPRVFPQLGRVKAIADSSGPHAGEIEPQELRHRVFAALRELLRKLAERSSLVLLIDDYQWAGADSTALLAEVLRGPDAPPLLLITTVRSDVRSDPVPTALSDDLRLVEVEGLPAADALALADALLGSSAARPGVANAIAAEAQGHPLFIDALVRNSAAGASGRALKLEEALRERIDRLDPTARRLVEVVAVAGTPVQQSVAARVARLELSELVSHVSSLRGAHLVRTRGGRASDAIEPYHDRVRAAALAALTGERRHELHRELALTLEANAGQADLESICQHWMAVGDAPRAGRWAVLAAQQASDALAFDRAARLYQQALQLRPELDPQRALELQVKLAEALGNAGRSHAAAQAYLRAAKVAVGARARELQRRAATHLLYAGHVDAGLEAVAQVLSSMGLAFPATPGQALMSLLISRVRIRLRGLRIVERPADTIPPEQLERIDTCFSIATGLGLVDIIRGAEFQARHILYALESGDTVRSARALAFESMFAAAAGPFGRRRVKSLLSRANELAQKTTDPRATAWVVGAHGFTELQQGRWLTAHDELTRAEEILRERCTGVRWELASMQVHRLMCLTVMGRLEELIERGRRYLSEAEDRGDLFASTMLRLGPMPAVWLALDDPEGGKRDTQAALTEWSSRGQGFHLQHLYGMQARAQYALYTGDGAGAFRILDEQEEAVRRSQMYRFQIMREALREQRARALLAWARASEGAARTELLTRVDADVRLLERERSAWSGALAKLYRASAAQLGGRTDRALVLLGEAEKQLAETHMHIYELCARRRRGELMGGAAGRALVDEMDATLRSRGARDPRKVVRLCAPGF
jgi:serine/threonine protein kinase/tetratricopeptide (TPR) repeat protein